jgi:hypothetical protein
VAALEHAPKTSDKIESCFAVLDRTLVLGASTHCLFGVAHSQLLKAFDAAATKEQLAKRAVAKRKKKNGGSGNQEEINEQVEAWDVTSFFSLPREKRWRIIKDVQRNYRDLCVLAPKKKVEEHDAAKVNRYRDARSKEIEKCLDRAARYAEFSLIAPCTTVEQLEALNTPSTSVNEHLKVLRDQIRVRRHVFGLKPKDLPLIGDDTGDGAVTRLEDALRMEVVKPLPAKPAPPPPYPVRPRHAAPTASAISLDQQHLVAVSAAWTQLMSMTNQSIFRVPRQHAATRARRAVAAPRQTATPQEVALSGTTFTEDAVDWKVLAPLWSEAQKVVLVWYYDEAAAAAAGVNEDSMRTFAAAVSCGVKDPGPCPSPLERSSVMEIREWICAFQGA